MAVAVPVRNALLNHILCGVPFPAPEAQFVGLFTEVPTADTPGVEVEGGSYARLAGGFDPPFEGATANDAALVWPNMPETTIRGIGVWDAATDGELLVYAPLTAYRSVIAAEDITLAAGDLDVTFA